MKKIPGWTLVALAVALFVGTGMSFAAATSVDGINGDAAARCTWKRDSNGELMYCCPTGCIYP